MTLLLSCQKNGRRVFSRGPSPTETNQSDAVFRLLFLFSAMFFVLPFPLLLGFILEKKNFCILATDSSFE